MPRSVGRPPSSFRRALISSARSAPSPSRGPRGALLVALVLPFAVLSARAPRALVITGARVLDVAAGRYIQPAVVVIENARITHLYPKPVPALPPDAETLDLPGVTLVPGLGDMHASASPSSEADADYHAALSLAYGVTMARNLDVALPWGVAQRERARTGEILAPLLWTSGPALEERAAGSLSAREVLDADGARREVGVQAAAKVDWITVNGNTRGEVYQAIIAAAHLARLRVGGHAVATSMAQLARLGIDAIDHLQCPARTRDEYQQLLAARPNGATDRPLFESIWSHLPAIDARTAIAQLVRARTVLVPTLAGALEDLQPDDVLKDPALPLLAAGRRDRLSAAVQDAGSARARDAAWQARARFVKDFVAAGGTVATGTDYAGTGFGVPGAGVLKELTLLVRAGLTPADAIKAATLNSAKMVGAAPSLGQIKSGYQADLIGVEGDPLQQIDDLGRIRLIVRGGEVLDRQQLLAQAHRALGGAPK